MITRRDVLKTGVAAGLAGVIGSRTTSAAAPQPLTKVNFDVPPAACDCHVHVFGDVSRYPFFTGRTYTPETATVQEAFAKHLAKYQAAPEAAKLAIRNGESPPKPGLPEPELAAWTLVANLLLNLDETITRN